MNKFNYTNDKIILINEDNNEVGFVLYSLNNNIFTIISTQVYDEYKGKGYAKILMNECERFLKENNYSLKPLCLYAKKYFSLNNDIKIIK